MSFIPTMMYIIGLVAFGIFYWILNGIVDILKAMNIAEQTDFGSYDLLIYLWAGIVIVYVIFGGIWLIRTYNEKNQTGELF